MFGGNSDGKVDKGGLIRRGTQLIVQRAIGQNLCAEPPQILFLIRKVHKSVSKF